MSIGQQILFFISALGAFNGLLLCLYLFFSKKNRTLPSILLGILLLAISIRVAKTVIVSFNPELPRIYRQIGLSFCFLIGPSLYYFYKAILMKVSKVPNSWKLVWGLIVGILIIGGILAPYETRPDIWNNYIAEAIYTQWLVYLLATGVLLWPMMMKYFRQSDQVTASEKFLLLVYLSNCCILFIHFIVMTGFAKGLCLSGAISFSFFLYLTGFFYFYNRRAENILHAEEIDLPAKSEKRKIADTDANNWMLKLEKVIRDKELYKDPNLKLNHLATQINITPHMLSQLLNDNFGKSFSTYINEFRIDEACKLITTNDRLTFEAIGYEVGYNSKSTFYAAFKKIKDTTPALFREGLEQARQVS